MNYLLDTCVLSEYVKKQPNTAVINWLDQQKEDNLLISILSVGELKKGIIKLERSQPIRSQSLWEWVERIEVRFEGRILTINQRVIDHWARLCGKLEAKGTKLAVLDSLIAATALVYDLAVVTRNVNDFNATTVRVFNPWELKNK